MRTKIKKYSSSIIWTLALVCIYFLPIASDASSLCLFSAVGFPYCPGCGLGHAMQAAMHFQWQDSLNYHLLGIPSIFALVYLIFKPFILPHHGSKSTINDAAGNAAAGIDEYSSNS